MKKAKFIMTVTLLTIVLSISLRSFSIPKPTIQNVVMGGCVTECNVSTCVHRQTVWATTVTCCGAYDPYFNGMTCTGSFPGN